ncbi:N-acetylneuraminate synthase family protein [Thalassospira sp.]|uniref:N-acetylneuraminate synthase family protein n=1 Tax=Thalassospira sp. TaxID=1912094 RepID=UPI001B017D64|nr:N-acetylneuraminate synthase family protein [Thalassospira sp.]MBO6805953.1 N-acetylneuraminate synthase family protein [Thalassospira sp.]
MIFIAEIGMNHNGNFGLIHELVRRAKESGADIAKFQLGWRWAEGEINQITPEIIELINKICDFYEIEPMFSIIVPEAWDMIKRFKFNRYKIASRTVVDYPELVEKVVREGKQTFVSLGMWSGADVPISKELGLVDYLYCKSLYPTAPWELDDLPKDFNSSIYTGYSDHTVGIETCLIAISRGATVIEKHFTLDKSDTTIRDHALSATPDEFLQLTTLGRGIAKRVALGQ